MRSLRAVSPLLAVLLAAGALQARGGEARSLEQVLRDHRGRVVVLNFWAAWCGPCKKEVPLLSRLHREYGSRGVQFVGASTDAADERDEAEAFLARAGVIYPVVFGLSDLEMRQMRLGELLPATAVFDRDGARAFRLVGEVTKKRLVERLDWLLGDRLESPPRELFLPPGVDAAQYED